MVKSYQSYINGEWETALQTLPIYSPEDHELMGYIPNLSKEEIDKAMHAANKSQKMWKETAYKERAILLHRVADYIRHHAEEWSIILSREIAKNIDSAKDEWLRTAELIDYTAEEGVRLEGELLEGGSFDSTAKHKMALVMQEPLGTVLAIAPFNYPVNLSASKIAPALIGGNTVVFKAPTQGAISGTLLIEAFDKAGFPKGVINLITGQGQQIGDYLVQHPQVDFINFTGSTKIGQHISQISGMKPLLLELGGKDAALVLEDADLKQAAKDIVSGAFSYSGQRCTAIKRVIVMKEVEQEFIHLLTTEINKLTVGTSDSNAIITPLINIKSADNVVQMINEAIQQGAIAHQPIIQKDNLVYPVLLSNVNKDMRVAIEEPFGPVLPILTVDSYEEAIQLINESQYGLQAAIFTKNYPRAFTISKMLEVGTIHINNKTQRGTDNFPFLGVKHSGLGVQGVKYAIKASMRPKSVVFDF